MPSCAPFWRSPRFPLLAQPLSLPLMLISDRQAASAASLTALLLPQILRLMLP